MMHSNRRNVPRRLNKSTASRGVLQDVSNNKYQSFIIQGPKSKSSEVLPSRNQPHRGLKRKSSALSTRKNHHVFTRKSSEVLPSRTKTNPATYKPVGSSRPLHLDPLSSKFSALTLQHTSLRPSNKPSRSTSSTASDYVLDMYKYFQDMERPIHPYMTGQSPIDSSIRSVLVSWLLDVSQKSLGLCDETLYLVVDILDSFLTKAANISESYLLLTGVASLLLASKYEEEYSRCPSLRELLAVTDHAFSKQDLLQMETFILRALGYRISALPSNPRKFLVRYLQGMTPEVSKLARFFLLQTLKSYKLRCEYPPSQLAAASVYMARQHFLGSTYTWPSALARHCNGYSSSQVAQVAQSMRTDPSFAPPPASSRKGSPNYRAGDKRPSSNMINQQAGLPPIKMLRLCL